MGSHKLREDKDCLNCGATVESRFCPDCGQENTGTRHSFAHLFTHFFEDFTHYDNAFWRTIKYLCFQPARLTREYLSGRRAAFVPPVRLYIFISFITFFLINVLPDADDYHQSAKDHQEENAAQKADSIAAKDVADKDFSKVPKNLYSLNDGRLGHTNVQIGSYGSVRELDSAQAAQPEKKKLGMIRYWLEHKLAQVNERNVDKKDFLAEVGEAFLHNLPKALFIYMPVFAFGHGIFTLHYFSFLLLTFSGLLIINSATSFLDDDLNSVIVGFLAFVLMLWWILYFFRSHRRMYGESRLISRTKSFVLFIINLFFIVQFMFVLIVISILSVK